ncbi:M-phase inducer phosphatase 2 [Chlorella vulgaris]
MLSIALYPLDRKRPAVGGLPLRLTASNDLAELRPHRVTKQNHQVQGKVISQGLGRQAAPQQQACSKPSPEMLEQHSTGTGSSLEFDILQLSQRWEAQRTIRSGNTPGPALRGTRAALASISANTAPRFDRNNPFNVACQRQAGNAENQQPGRAAAPEHAFTFDKSVAATARPQADGASCDSPSPDITFRGRLSFAAAEAASADMSAAFPTLVKPFAKQRRRSFSHADARWSGLALAADPAADGAAAAPAEGARVATDSDACSLLKYWSDPLPLPAGLASEAVAVPAVGGAGAAQVAGDEDMGDTASPVSSVNAGPAAMCSPALAATACSGLGHSPIQSMPLSPIPGHQQHVLPTVDQPDCSFPAITATTMRDLLVHGAPAFGLDGFVVVDCRHAYEFDGGQLPGAVQLTTPEAIQGFLAQAHGVKAGCAPAAAGSGDLWQRTAIIFHCEFSTERGPRAAKWVRNQDRAAHMHDYPALSHPHVFVLQGGYKAFWRAFPELCEGGYRPMDHPDFTEQLKACHKTVKQAWAKTTHTYSLKQRQRRPSYRLRQSSGAPSGSTRDSDMAPAEDAANETAHLMECCPHLHNDREAAMLRLIQNRVVPSGSAPLAGSPSLSFVEQTGGNEAQQELDKQADRTKLWKDKAHKLGEIIVRQEAQTRETQRQLDTLLAAQAAALAAATANGADTLSSADIASMRQQLVLAQAQLQQQYKELEEAQANFKQQQSLLKEAAGVARHEVLKLQAANREHQAQANRLQLQNEQLRAAQGGGVGEALSAGPSPAKRHADATLLQAMVRKQEQELCLLREDSTSQQAELMRSLALLQAAHKGEEDLRRQVSSLEGQLAITRDELSQKDAHLDLLREKLDEDQEVLRQLGKQLAAAELAAEAATGSGTSSREAERLQEEAAALRQRWQLAEAELSASQQECNAVVAEALQLRQQLQQRDSEVAQLRLQIPDLRAELTHLQLRADAASSKAATVQEELHGVQLQMGRQQQEAADLLAEQQRSAADMLEQVRLETAAQLEQQQLAAAAQLADRLEQALVSAERKEAAASLVAAQRAAADRAQLEERLAQLLCELEQASEARDELEARLGSAAAEQAGFAEQLRAAAAVMLAAEEQVAQQQAVAQEQLQEQAAGFGAQAAEQLAAAQQAAAVQGEALQQLQDAETRLSKVQQRLTEAEACQVALQSQLKEQEAGVQWQLSAAAGERDAWHRQLLRLQSDVSDAELLLASFLGSNSSSCSSLFGTPAASPKRPASSPAPAAEGGADQDVASEVAAAVQWLQQTHQQQQQQQALQQDVEPVADAHAMAARSGGSNSRLCRRILLVLAELQRLQQQQRAHEAASARAEASPRPHSAPAGGCLSVGAPPSSEASEELAALAEGSDFARELPLLSPVNSHNSSALIAAVRPGSGVMLNLEQEEHSCVLQASLAMLLWYTTAHLYPVSCICGVHASQESFGQAAGASNKCVRCCAVQATPDATQSASSSARKLKKRLAAATDGHRDLQRSASKPGPVSKSSSRGGRERGGQPKLLQLVVRTAGVAGLVSALALRVLQHAGR